MKKRYLLFFSLLSVAFLQAQTDTTILFIPCKSGMLVIDGVEKGNVDADDVHRERLRLGDHYIQLKTSVKKYNTTIRITSAISSNMVKIGCDDQAIPTIKILDKKLTLVGVMDPAKEKNIIALDAGDELIINCHLTNAKGTANISITRQETGAELFRKDAFAAIDNEHIKIQQKGIYVIMLSTNALFGREAQVTLERQPGANSSADFNTNIQYVVDTTFVEVQTTRTRVYSTTSGRINRTVVNIDLPEHTSYWTYWIAVDNAAQQQMANLAATVANIGKVATANPLVQFGAGILKELPLINMTSTVSYRFTDDQNGQLFLAGQRYSRLPFKYANNISSDYAIVSDNQMRNLALCFDNQSTINGHDLEIRVVAFIIKKRMAIK
jgi:hypothetical protein